MFFFFILELEKFSKIAEVQALFYLVLLLLFFKFTLFFP